MAFYQLIVHQDIEAPLEKVWEFISAPQNLQEITPDYMGFEILSKDLPAVMYEGMIISYMVSPILGIKTNWVTEITQIKEKRYFVDEQRIGPYKMWHHQHFIEPSGAGTRMKDIVSYQPPFGLLGSIANKLVIERKLAEIFQYRKEAIVKKFG